MITFDEKTKTLVGKKCPDAKITIDPVTPHLESYRKYRNETLEEDIEDLREIIERICKMDGLSIHHTLVDNDLDSKELKNASSGYYQVFVTFDYNGNVNKDIPLFKLPYQDCYGVYTFPSGGRRALYSELTNLEDISIDREKNKLNIVLPKRSLSINKEKVITKGFSFKMYGKSLSYQKILKHFAFMEGVELPEFKSYFANANILMSALDNNSIMPTAAKLEDSKVNFYEAIKSNPYRLGRLREALNERLVIDYCLNKKLSRDVYLMDGDCVPTGTVVTSELLERFKRNRVNEVYCRALPCIEGSTLSMMTHIPRLKEGTEITKIVRDHLIKHNINIESSFLEEDLDVPMFFKAGTKISLDMIKLFADSGMTELFIKKPGVDSMPVVITFEQEYIGNRTVKLKYVCDPMSIPSNKSAEDYVHFDEYGIIDDDYSCPDNLTLDDLLALISYFSRNINYKDSTEVVNRDFDFLKKLNMANEIFSSVFYKAATSFVMKYRDKIKEALSVHNNELKCKERFIGFYDMWRSTLNNTKLVRLSMDVNTLTMYSQCLRAVVPVKSDRHVSKNMRMLTMFHEGRFCNYDSPAGRKIGLVCTLSIGCRVEDGILKVPKRHIQNRRLTDDVKYFSPREELGIISSDALNMKIVDGIIQDSQVPARIPAITDEENRIRIGNISSLQVEYVNAFSEQSMSPTPAAVPFAGSDDSARLGFSTNLQNQTKSLIFSEVPYVYTRMYKQIYDIPNDYVIRAEADGVVTGIYKNSISLDYEETRYTETLYVDYVPDARLNQWDSAPDFEKGQLISDFPEKRAQYDGRIISFDSTKVTYEYIIKAQKVTIPIKETKLMNETVMVSNIKVSLGDRVNRGDILIDTPISRDGIYSPGLNAFTAFISNDGYNYEDGLNMSIDFAQLNTSISVHEEEKKINTENYTAIVSAMRVNNYIRKGDIISVIDRTSNDDLSDKRKERWVSRKYEGLLYSITKCKDTYASDKNVKRYSAKIINFNSITEADKGAGRHGNKGVTTHIFKTSEMPMAKNGKSFDLVLNPHGVASRMNLGQILELYSGLAAYITGTRIETDAFNGLSTFEVYILVKFAHHCCNVYDFSKESEIQRAIEDFGEYLPTNFIRYAATRYEFYKDWKDVFDEHGLAEIYDPVTNTYLKRKAAIGFTYFLKIKQEVESKMHVRGGLLEDEPYTAKNYAPTQGASRQGGQANGEMEIMGLLGHSANYLVHEYTTTKADNLPKRYNLLSKAIGGEEVFSENEYLNRTTAVLEYFLEVLGYKMDCMYLGPELTDKYISELRKYDRANIADAYLKARKDKARKNANISLPRAIGKTTGAVDEEDILGASDSAVLRDLEILSHSSNALEAEESAVGIDSDSNNELDLSNLEL